MNEHDNRRAARRQDLILLFAGACAAGYTPAAPRALSALAHAHVPAQAVPGPGTRAPAGDLAAPPAL